MKLRVLLLALFSIALVHQATAQKTKKKDKDVQIIDFGDDGSSSKTQKKNYKGMILKTSPTSYIFGRQSVEWEKELSQSISVQLGGGITFLPLWGEYQSLITELQPEGDENCNSTTWAIDECDYYWDYSIREGRLGYQVSASSRLFFDSDGYEGMYIAPVFRLSTQNYKVQKIIEDNPWLQRIPDEFQNESVRNTDIMVHWGYQTLYPLLSFEWFIGGGIRFRHNVRQDVGADEFNLYHNGETTFNDKRFRFEAGLRVGFQL